MPIPQRLNLTSRSFSTKKVGGVQLNMCLYHILFRYNLGTSVFLGLDFEKIALSKFCCHNSTWGWQSPFILFLLWGCYLLGPQKMPDCLLLRECLMMLITADHWYIDEEEEWEIFHLIIWRFRLLTRHMSSLYIPSFAWVVNVLSSDIYSSFVAFLTP